MVNTSLSRVTSMFPFCFKNNSSSVNVFRRIRQKIIFIAGMKFSSPVWWNRNIWKDCACKDRKYIW